MAIASLSALLALPRELSSQPGSSLPLPRSLFESRLSLCEESAAQRRGCEAAFHTLRELAERPAAAIPKAKELELLSARLQELRIPESSWVNSAFNAWLAALDPHARIQSAVDSDRKASAERILVQGAGAKLRFFRGKVFVAYSIEGSAAERAGLRGGDRVLELNGKKLERVSQALMERWLASSRSPYDVLLEREGKLLRLRFSERRFLLPNVESGLSAGRAGAGWIRVRSFDKESTCRELHEAIRRLERLGARELRLDLRDNPGGLVRSAQCAAGLFLGEGRAFARLHPLDNPEPARLVGAAAERAEELLLLTDRAIATRLPLVVELNQNSASAAEMLAAALQDHGRARVSGARSFGKGSMQSLAHPWNNELLYFTRTTHSILRPSGKPLQYEGVRPDLLSHGAEGENFPRERELTL